MLLIGLFAILLAAAPAARAAEQSGAAPSVSELEALVTTIEDPAAREKLVGQLKALIAAQREAQPEPGAEEIGAGIVADLSRRLARASQSVADAADALRDAPQISRWLKRQVEDPAAIERWKAVALYVVLALAAGFVAEWIARALLRRPRRTATPNGDEGWLARSGLVLVAIVLDLMPLIAFAAGAYGILAAADPPRVARLVAITIANAYLLSSVLMALATWLLDPPIATARLHRLREETSHYLNIWARRFILVLAIGWFTAEALRPLGLPQAGYVAVLKVLGLIVLGMVIVLILQNRSSVADLIAAEVQEEGAAPRRFARLRRRVGDIWHPLAIIYAVALYVIWALEIEGGFPFMLRGTILTALVLLIAAGVNMAIRRGSGRLFAVRADLRQRFPGLEARANRYLPIMQNILHGIVWAAAAIAVLSAWGADVAGWLQDGFGRRVLQAVFTIGIVTILAIVIWEGVSAAIVRYLTKTDASGKPLTRSSRVRSLLPVLRNLVFVVLATMVVLISLSELGVNIAPLLATAGVAGLAIGFGAQTLVKDVITGAFIMFEDSVAVGDVVKAGDYAGLVESLSIRSMRLRDFNGNVHVVPFSTVNQITNMTKDFSFYVFDVNVAYREDTDQVTEVLKQIGAELQEDPNFGYMILEPLEVVGVDAFKDSGVVIKARIKTAPIRQWTVGREMNRRIKKRFDELGIEIPFPHVTLYFGQTKQGEAPPARIEMQALELREREAKSEGEAPQPAQHRPAAS
jgi:small conductance mechanosensitive channel